MTKTNIVVAYPPQESGEAKVIARPPSLPAWLERATSDGHRPPVTIGFTPKGWVPPPCLSAEEAAEIKAKAELLRRSCRPADEWFLKRQFALLAACTQLEDQTESVWLARQEALLEDIRDLGIPPDIVAKACRQLRRTKRFFPLNCEFLEVAIPLWEKRKTLRRRLEVLLWVAENPAPGGEVTLGWYRQILAKAGQGAQATSPRCDGPKPIGNVVERLRRE